MKTAYECLIKSDNFKKPRMKALKHLNKYFYKYRVRLLLGVLFVGTSNFFGVYSIQYVRKAIDYIRDLYPGKTGLPEDVSYQLLMFTLAILGATLLNGFFMFLMRQTIIVVSRLIEYDLKNEIYEHYQKLDISFYKKNNTGDLMNRISEDVSRVRMYIGPALMYIVNTIITFVLTIVVMINVDFRLTFYVLLPLPALVVSIYYVSDIINKKGTWVQEQLSGLSTIAQESFSGIRVLKAYNREDHFGKEFEKESIKYRKMNLGLVKTEALFQPFMILLMGLSTILTIYYGGMETMRGKVSVGNIAEFILYVNRLTWPIVSLGWVTSLIQRAAASQKRINEFLITEPAITPGKHHQPYHPPVNINGSVEFKNVEFTYDDSGIKALDGVSFTIKPGTSLGIIGRTGSGKSTIANLLCRLYDVNRGEVLVDGRNVKNIDLNDLRKQTGYVPQDVFLFSDTIAGNIAFGYAGARNKNAIEQAAKDAAIYSNIMLFPQKFETIVGERGITLSGGQKQRISIARAIIKSPKILIFDDCLSAVDTETEEEILKNLQQVMRGKTSVIIGHRVSSVKNAGHIIVLDKGRIVEEGTHRQLLDNKGIYADINKKQMLEER